MPKHQANLDFVVSSGSSRASTTSTASSRCGSRSIGPGSPASRSPPPAVNYCAFRGLLMKSSVYFRGRAGINLPFARSARLLIGDHPRVAALKRLKIGARPILSAWFPRDPRRPRRSLRGLVPLPRGASRAPSRGPRERRRPGAGQGLASASGARDHASLPRTKGQPAPALIPPAPPSNVLASSPARPGSWAGAPATIAALRIG